MKWGFILAGIAGAVAYYLYSSLTEEQKKEMIDNLKEKGENLKQKGKKIYDEYVPDNIKNKFPAAQ